MRSQGCGQLFALICCVLPLLVYNCVEDHADQKRKATKRPNFILFVADDMGWGDLSSYGHPTQEPGPIDKLAQEGMRFTHWYAPAVYCTPSRAAMLTGGYFVFL